MTLSKVEWDLISLPRQSFLAATGAIKVPVLMKTYFVYILASKRNGTLYIGVTSNLIKRIWEHKNKLADGFRSKYGVDRLVYYESAGEPHAAIQREKRMKKYPRQWKVELIEKGNPEWEDLYESIL